MPGERLSEEMMGMRAAQEIQDGMLVNLGGGLPSYCALHPPTDREFWFHAENGIIGFGAIITDAAEADPKMINAAGQPVRRRPGLAVVDHAESFAMIRGGHIDLTILGSLEVSEQGDLANWLAPGRRVGTLGGAMDLAMCCKRVVALMTHTNRNNEPKVVRSCRTPITAPRSVHRIITDLAVIDVTPAGLVLKEVAPGWTAEDVQALTEPVLAVAPDLRLMSF